jgi:hypothetical protein
LFADVLDEEAVEDAAKAVVIGPKADEGANEIVLTAVFFDANSKGHH